LNIIYLITPYMPISSRLCIHAYGNDTIFRRKIAVVRRLSVASNLFSYFYVILKNWCQGLVRDLFMSVWSNCIYRLTTSIYNVQEIIYRLLHTHSRRCKKPVTFRELLLSGIVYRFYAHRTHTSHPPPLTHPLIHTLIITHPSHSHHPYSFPPTHTPSLPTSHPLLPTHIHRVIRICFTL